MKDILSILWTVIRLSIRRYTVLFLYNEKSLPVWVLSKIIIFSSELLSFISISEFDLTTGNMF